MFCFLTKFDKSDRIPGKGRRITLKKQIIIALTALLIVATACFAGGSYYFLHPENENKIVSLELPPYSEDITLAVGETAHDKFITVIFDNAFSASEIKFESSDKSVAEAKYTFTDRNRYVCFKVQAKSVGKAEIYFTADNGNIKSEKINVNVIEKNKPVKAATVSHNEISGEASKATGKDNVSVTEAKDDTVYISPTGKRYHYLESCAGKNGSEVKKSEAISRGKTPCKKCAGG